MRTLAERIYDIDGEERGRLLPYGLHPAKMNLALTFDLGRRYLLRGQTVIDPFFGIGGTGVLLLEGVGVVGIELERHHYEDASRNLSHLTRIAQDMGHTPNFSLWHGDSQEVLLAIGPPRAFADSALTSPAFGEMNAEHAGGAITQRPNKDGVGFEGSKDYFTYDRDPRGADGSLTPPPYQDARSDWRTAEGQGNIRYSAPGEPGDGFAGTITSPPYADALNETPEAAARQRERVTEKIANGAAHPEGTKWGRRGSWGGGTAHRVPQGYEGILPGADAGMTSPPYDDVLKRNRSEEPYAKNHPELSREYGRDDKARSADGYGKTSAQIGNMRLKDNTYQTACLNVYARLYDAIKPGGVLVVVTGDYVRDGKVVDLAGLTIDLCQQAGWTPVERWRARKKRVSFWRILHNKREKERAEAEGRDPDESKLINYEDCLVFCKGDEPGWEFTDLPPTGVVDEPEMAPLF